jgi:4-amino-4-deoxy-L-arabinose transferase-like glycosyltransferase
MSRCLEVIVSTVLADPFLHPPDLSSAPPGQRRRWEVWRSPTDQPPWARPLLLVIGAVAALLFAWNIADAGLAPFYSVAVKSMSESWKAFFYGAFDPRATITIDKLAGSFLPQALSARIFGFHPWSLALPQVIEGVVAVLAMYRAVRRWAGVQAGLLAAFLLALTPIAASMFGHSMEDGALTMCLVLAADAWTRAVTEGRLRSLVWAGVWIGLGFQCKMMQAWIVLPALVLGYLLCASPRLGRRLWHLLVFGVVTVGVSLSWILLYTFTPANDRPYVDGSTNNSAWSMVFGYNGLERFGISVPGAVTSGPGVTAVGGAGAPAGGEAGQAHGFGGAGHSFGGAAGHGFGAGGFGTGWTKLLGSSYGPEIGWLFPLAVLALICGLLWTRRAGRSDRSRSGFVMWGLWLITFGLVFSDMSTIPHTAYVASLAPALAALSAAGIVMFWRMYRAGSRRGWMLPVVVAVSLAWAVFLWRSYSGFLPWTLWTAVGLGVVALVVMVWARLSPGMPSRRTWLRFVTAGLAVGVASMVAAPATWAASVLDAKYAGSSFNASAGPAGGMGFGGGGFGGAGKVPGGARDALAELGEGTRGGFGGFRDAGAPGAPGAVGNAPGSSGTPGSSGAPGAGGAPSSGVPGGFRGGFGGASGGAGGFGGAGMLGATQSLTSSERAIYDYVSAHRGGAGYLMAVASWSEASPYILTTGQEVLPMGGFSGSVPEPTLAKVQQLVRSGQLRFFLLSATSGSRSGPGGFAGFGARGGSSSTAATIGAWVKKTCTPVPAKDYGGSTSSASGSAGPGGPGGTETLYACGG